MQPSSASPVVFHVGQVSQSSQTSGSPNVQSPAISQVPSTSATVMPSASTVPHSQAQSTPQPQPIVPRAAQQGATLDQSCLTATGVAGFVGSTAAGTIACCFSPLVGLQICSYGFTATGALVTAGGLHDAVSTSHLCGADASHQAGPVAPQQASMQDGQAPAPQQRPGAVQHPAVTTGGGITVSSMGLTGLSVMGAIPGVPLPMLGVFAGVSLACYGACKD